MMILFPDQAAFLAQYFQYLNYLKFLQDLSELQRQTAKLAIEQNKFEKIQDEQFQEIAEEMDLIYSRPIACSTPIPEEKVTPKIWRPF